MHNTNMNFAGAIACGDGRIVIPTIDFLKQHFDVQFVDYASAPGCDGMFLKSSTGDQNDITQLELLKKQYQIYYRAHHHIMTAIVGHEHCAGNPTTPDQHKADIQAGVKQALTWNFATPVIGLWVSEKNETKNNFFVHSLFDPKINSESFVDV